MKFSPTYFIVGNFGLLISPSPAEDAISIFYYFSLGDSPSMALPMKEGGASILTITI
jgi:hypothetical protein